MATSVAVAVGAAAEPPVAAIRERVAALRVGPASDPHAEMGPVITAQARDRVRRYIERGKSDGPGPSPTAAPPRCHRAR